MQSLCKTSVICNLENGGISLPCMVSEIVCDALLVADHCIKEENGKNSVIGIFENFNFPSFPSPPVPSFFIFAKVRNLPEGKITFAFNIVHEKDQQVFSPINGEFENHQRRVGASFSFRVSNFSFPKEGEYSVKLVMNGSFIHSTPLTVSRIQPKT